jgi:hypothetical protein
VHRAWPHRGKAPKGALARWLAKQVGPTRVTACRIRRHRRTVACRRKKLRRKSALPPGFRGQMIRLHADTTTSTGSATLQLVRSFDIPTSDPSYVRVLNWSWTYDSAISTSSLTQSLNSIAAVTAGAGGAPLQADRTVISPAYGAESTCGPRLLRAHACCSPSTSRRRRCSPASVDMHF